MAGRAAVAGAGALADLLDRGQPEHRDGLDDGVFGDLQAVAQKLAGAGVAVAVEGAVVHRKRLPGREFSRRVILRHSLNTLNCTAPRRPVK